MNFKVPEYSVSIQINNLEARYLVNKPKSDDATFCLGLRDALRTSAIMTSNVTGNRNGSTLVIHMGVFGSSVRKSEIEACIGRYLKAAVLPSAFKHVILVVSEPEQTGL